MRKTDSRHKLNLAFSVCNNDTVRAQLLNLYLFAAVLYRGGGVHIHIHSVYTAMQISASKHLSKGN